MRWALGLALSACAGVASAQVYPTSPDWSSADMQVSTGGAFADINGDGWLDFVVANGNDISQQRVVCYFNNGAGQLQTSPGWQSAAVAYHGHCAVADINGDGWPDVAVAVLLAQGGPSAKLFLNNGGTLSTTPAWSAPVSADSFGVAFGDMNGDGRPDLAVASGEAYNNVPRQNCVYLNVGGALSTTISWQTATARNFNNCLWLDADDDGRLDLCYTGSNTDTFVFRNLGTLLETTPSWRTNDIRNQFALMVAAGDVTGDGREDLVLADNNQLFTGSGRFRQYNGLVAGNFSQTANWTYSDGYTAAVALGDINNDGLLDLCTGEWFGRTRYFLNTGSGFPVAPTWSNTGTSTTTVEKLVLGDVDNASLKVAVADFAASGSRRLFHLPHRQVQRIVSVAVDGVDLTPAQYTADRENAWISVGLTPAVGVRVVYVRSRSLDMGVTNWDDNRPNQLYYNRLTPPCPADFDDNTFVNGDDFDFFTEAFVAGDPRADYDVNSFVNGDDYDLFSIDFINGC